MRQQSIEIEGVRHINHIPMACRIGPILATSGISGRNAASGEMSDSIDEQLFHAFANLKAVLRKAEMDLGDVVKITVLVSDDTVKPLITPRWVIEYPDPEHRPARKTVVASLPEGSRVRLEALAVARNLS